jgi:hypothetical protein
MTFPVSPTNNSTTNVNGITYVYASATNSWTRVTTTSVHTGAIPNTVALRDATGSLTAVNFHGFATSAAYADLAEKYSADTDYPAGTVVVFGGEQEITITEIDHDSRVAGVISTNPALFNEFRINRSTGSTNRSCSVSCTRASRQRRLIGNK